MSKVSRLLLSRDHANTKLALSILENSTFPKELFIEIDSFFAGFPTWACTSLGLIPDFKGPKPIYGLISYLYFMKKNYNLNYYKTIFRHYHIFSNNNIATSGSAMIAFNFGAATTSCRKDKRKSLGKKSILIKL